MLNDRQFEDLLNLTADAEQAGVFRATPIDAHSIMQQAHNEMSSESSWRWGLLAGPLAACLVAAFGLSQFWPAAPQNRVAQSTRNAGSVIMADSVERCGGDFTLFNTCFTGPAQDELSAECRCVDLDKDGDVDFADFGLMQRASALSNG